MLCAIARFIRRVEHFCFLDESTTENETDVMGGPLWPLESTIYAAIQLISVSYDGSL